MVGLGCATFQVQKRQRSLMAETLFERLGRLLPDGRGVWIPMDHGVSAYPEAGLERMDEVVDACIEAGADAVVLQKGALSHQFERSGWNRSNPPIFDLQSKEGPCARGLTRMT